MPPMSRMASSSTSLWGQGGGGVRLRVRVKP